MFTLQHDQFGRLVLTDASGKEHVGVEPVRCFPISAPERGISLVDPHGAEVQFIDELDKLPTEQRAVLLQHLAQREFMPVLQKIVRVSSYQEPCEWTVETDRGQTRFLLKSEENVRRLGEFRALIVDAHGVRYHIPDIRRLDPRSRKLLEWFL